MKRILSMVLALAAVLCTLTVTAVGTQADDLVLQDISYDELIGRVNQVDSGFTINSTYIYSGGRHEGEEPKNDSGFQFYYLGLEKWSTDAGGEDGPIPDWYLDWLDRSLANLRANGGGCIIRATYALDGLTEREPQTFELLLEHQSQLAGVFSKYPDLIVAVECGMIGAFGEMWGGKYSGASYKAKVLHGWLTQLPEEITVNVRTAAEYINYLLNYGYKEKYSGKTVDGIAYPSSIHEENFYLYTFDGEDYSRIGCYNDAMIQDGNDGGSFAGGRDNFNAWLNMKSAKTTYGGEFSGAAGEYRFGFGQWLPMRAIPEFYLNHLTYYHGGNAAYADVGHYKSKYSANRTYTSLAKAQADIDAFNDRMETYGAGMSYSTSIDGTTVTYTMGGWESAKLTDALIDEIDAKIGLSADLSAYKDKSVSSFFEDHLCYRLVLKESKISASVAPGGILRLEGAVDNTGFSNIVRKKVVEIELRSGSNVYTAATDVNANSWIGGSRNYYKLSIRLPKDIPTGDYEVYMRIAGTDPEGNTASAGCIRFANAGKYTYNVPGSAYSVYSSTVKIIYNSDVHANYIGALTVSGTATGDGDANSVQITTCEKGHAFGAWNTVFESNCVDKGRLERVCEQCGYVEREVTSPHDFDTKWTIDKEPTLKTSGHKAHYCLRGCGKSADGTTVPRLVDVASVYPDAKSGAWYYDAVQYAVSNGMFNGVSANEFKPNNTMNRAMLVSVLYRMEDSPSVAGISNTFGDVASGKYYTEAVIWASSNEIVNGTNPGVFSPNNNITREQMAAILFRYAQYKGYDTSKSANLNAFPDGGTTSNYAKEALAWANAQELITGTSAGAGSPVLLSPKGSATRAQVATILMRFRKTFEYNN